MSTNLLEKDFRSSVLSELRKRFPGCYLLLCDPSHFQGLPDLLILHGNRWAMLEFKRSETSPHRPNQDWYITEFGKMSFASFIYPENREEVLNALAAALNN